MRDEVEAEEEDNESYHRELLAIYKRLHSPARIAQN